MSTMLFLFLQPRKSVVTVYALHQNTKEWKIETTPYFLHKAMQSPILKLLPTFPAVIIYDKTEVRYSNFCCPGAAKHLNTVYFYRVSTGQLGHNQFAFQN